MKQNAHVRFAAEETRPAKLKFGGAHRYRIDRSTGVRWVARQSVDGVGDRYTHRIRGQKRYLWLKKGRWFVEAKG